MHSLSACSNFFICLLFYSPSVAENFEPFTIFLEIRKDWLCKENVKNILGGTGELTNIHSDFFCLPLVTITEDNNVSIDQFTFDSDISCQDTVFRDVVRVMLSSCLFMVRSIM